ncbi:MAG: hypothetical protein JNK82_39185 [Myxococcaceae bacterium]|nr:hypothetical protein [Myxococcaceae bacterium]
MRTYVFVLVVCACGPSAPRPTAAPRPTCPRVPPLEASIITLDDGRRAKVEAGLAYDDVGGEWRFAEEVYAADWFEKAYEVDAQCSISRRADDGTRYAVREPFADGFDGVTDFVALFGPLRGWTAMTLQSPSAPQVADYVALRACLTERTCDYRDSRFDVRDEAERGPFIRATSVPKTAAMVTAKASFESGLGYFVKGDDVWLRARVRAEQGVPFGLFDLESSFVTSAPGPRIVLVDGALAVELKALDKPTWKQATPFPLRRWVLVEAHYRLDDDPTKGLVELWQDGVQLLSAPGRTLPFSDIVLDHIEVGVTASNDTSTNTVLDVDDVRVGLLQGP